MEQNTELLLQVLEATGELSRDDFNRAFTMEEIINVRDYLYKRNLFNLVFIIQSKIDYKVSNELKEAFKSIDNK